MNSYLVNPDEQQLGSGEPLKLTSLLYFKEALSDERYEQCAEILAIAKEFGVDQSEVQKLVQEHIVLLQKRGKMIKPFARTKP